MIARSISGISYSNGVMIVAFTDPSVPDESWNLALANTPVAVEQAPYAGTENVPALVARGLQQVVVTFNDPAVPGKLFRVDVRDINDGADYPTPQDLIDEIIANIPNGGGGGGVTSVNGDTGPAVVLAFSEVGGGGVRLLWSGGANPVGGEFGADSGVVGSVTELRFSYAAIAAPYRVFEALGASGSLIVLTAYSDNSDVQTSVSFRVTGPAVDDPLNQWFAVPASSGDPSGATLGSGGEIWYMTVIPI